MLRRVFVIILFLGFFENVVIYSCAGGIYRRFTLFFRTLRRVALCFIEGVFDAFS
jgi:hypothetical protein